MFVHTRQNVWNDLILRMSSHSYQIHNSEFDCVHEAAVVHTMTVVSAAALAYAEREKGVDGKSLLAALVLGVDVACHMSVASNASLSLSSSG